MRRKIPFVVGEIYHVYNRGVAKCPICTQEADYWRFLQGLCLFNDTKSATNILWQLQKTRGRLTLNVLKKYLIDEGNERKPLVKILAYCVRENHFHLLIEEIQEGGITKFMHKLGQGYARYFNNKYKRVGHLWQDRFKNIVVEDERYLLYLLVYINVLNPAESIEPDWKEKGIENVEKILEFVENYQWSTHQEYLGKRGSIIINKGILGNLLPTPEDYLELVRSVLEEKKYREIIPLMLE
jgi:putative transposase